MPKETELTRLKKDNSRLTADVKSLTDDSVGQKVRVQELYAELTEVKNENQTLKAKLQEDLEYIDVLRKQLRQSGTKLAELTEQSKNTKNEDKVREVLEKANMKLRSQKEYTEKETITKFNKKWIQQVSEGGERTGDDLTENGSYCYCIQ